MYDDTILERFWSKVNKTSGCWEWQNATNACGYGTFKLNKKMMSAHRIAWRITRGPIPKDMCVLHHCDNPACVNPDHLFIGTHSDNIKDAVIKGRVVPPDSRGERHGKSRLTENDVHEIRRLHSFGIKQKILGKMWRTSRRNVSWIVCKGNWRHI